MPDTVIITIDYDGRWMDFELPAKLPFASWQDSLRANVRVCFPGIRLEGCEIELWVSGGQLQQEDTLEDLGIYDGARAELRLVG